MTTAVTGFAPISVPATRYKQGGRRAYIVVTRLDQALAIIPERVEPDLIKDANRRLHEPHAKAFGEYLWETDGWISGPMVVGVKPNRLTFDPFEEGEDIGSLQFPLELVNSPEVRLIDGQHRRYGLRYVFDRESTAVEKMKDQLRRAKGNGQTAAVLTNMERQLRDRQNRLNQLKQESIPLIIVEEDGLDKLRQLFADLAKNRPPDPITVSRFDARNPFNLAAVELMDHPLLKGHIDTERSRLNSSSPYMSTLNQFANNVLKVLAVGINGRVSKRVLAGKKAKNIEDDGRHFLDDVVAARTELAELADERLTVADLRQAGNLLVSPTMTRVLAGIWWEVVIRGGKPREMFVNWLRGAQMTPTNEPNIWASAGLVRFEDGSWSTPTARMQEVRRSVSLAASTATAQVLDGQARIAAQKYAAEHAATETDTPPAKDA